MLAAESPAESIASLEADIDLLSLDVKNISDEIHSCEEIIRLCGEFLNRPENADIAKRADELIEEIKTANESISEANRTIVRCDCTVTSLNEQLEKSRKNVQKLIEHISGTGSNRKSSFLKSGARI